MNKFYFQISKLKLDSARKKGINPVTGRPLWRWVEGDDGYRRPGSKGKAKKLFHRDIQRGGNSDEILSVGDCAVFLSTARVDRPYIGKVELLWETWNGNMMVKVKWFYHPEEIETTGKKFDLKHAVSHSTRLVLFIPRFIHFILCSSHMLLISPEITI